MWLSYAPNFQYAWRRRPILFETYRVKTSFAWNKYDNSDDKTDTDVIMLDKRSLKTRFVPLEQVTIFFIKSLK